MTRQALTVTSASKIGPTRKRVELPKLKDVDGKPVILLIKKVSLLKLSVYMKNLPGAKPKGETEDFSILGTEEAIARIERMEQYFDISHQVIVAGCESPKFVITETVGDSESVTVDALFEDDKLFLFEEILALSGYIVSDKEGQQDAVTFSDGGRRSRRTNGKRNRKARVNLEQKPVGSVA